jgi:predicted ATPase
MKKIVLTGGPCAGKSTVLEVLEKKFAGRVLVVPEVATMLLSGGFPVPGKHLKWSVEWQEAFQKAVLPVQKQLEDAFELRAKEMGIDLLVCDRGTLDGAAYSFGGPGAFCRKHGLDVESEYARYEVVIHLESTATGDPERYGKANNTSRFEDLEEAKRLEIRTADAWSSHPDFCFVSCDGGIEGKITAAIEIVASLLK